jgi:hypothetical protein
MSEWSLEKILSSLHADIQHQLTAAREALSHPVSKGDASERIWLDLLQKYLPKRYQAEKAFIVDSKGLFSEQIDVVIFDRQYSPFIFNFGGQLVIPSESVYAVFETKQTINASVINYAHKKILSVRKLHRTSLPIPHAGGTFSAKSLIHIIGGLLTLDSDWNPTFGKAFKKALGTGKRDCQLDIGCVASYGHFTRKVDGAYDMVDGGKPATAFLFKLISQLQFSGTVPMIDIDAYGKWLIK